MLPKEQSKLICNKLGLEPDKDFIPAWRDKRAVSVVQMIEALIYSNNYDEAILKVGRNRNTFKRNVGSHFPNVKLVGRDTWRAWLLRLIDLKYCGGCKNIKENTEFPKASLSKDGLHSECRSCSNFRTSEYFKDNKAVCNSYSANRRASIRNATPKWANLDKIKSIYKNCPTGYHVDHIIPLKGKIVSGLHVENNLQYLSAKENLEKHNKFL